MKTNLKKAISAVSALAIVSSLAPATFAAKLALSDVADTASYATAVNTLVALNVINGYEDGSFKPDDLITRAEVTKVMVAALNQIESAEGMKGSTKFPDVEAKHEWATGFINAGVQEGYINGYDDGTFKPDANVTYAQIVKMLISAMGYDEYANFFGGYPNGYLSIANSEGVTSGVKANANDNVSRAQVAQLVYNALTTPIVENTGMEWTSDGKMVPSIAKMNGQNDNKYKTILTERFDAYYVEGYITETSKGGALKSDEVKFGIAKSEKYDSEDFGLESFSSTKSVQSLTDVLADPKRIVTAKVGDTDAADFEGVYAAAIIMVDEYDDNIIISFQASGKNKTVKVAADLIDVDEYEDKPFAGRTENFLYIFANDTATKSTKYNLQKDGDKLDVKVYVNGFLMSGDARQLINDYVIGADVGEVELVDTYKTDGYYDTIYVNKYATAQIDSVTASSKKITFKSSKGVNGLASLTLDEDINEDLVYNIYLDGEKIALTDLKKDDVVSIAYEVNNGDKNDVMNSNHIDMYVSRNVQTGKLTARDESDKTVTIGGTEYKFVDKYDSNLKMGDEYEIYVDYFGRIYKTELNTSVAKYAIIDKFVYSSSEENYRVTMFTADGETKTLTFDGNKATVTIGNKPAGTDKTTKQRAIAERVYTNGEDAKGGRNVIENRVIKYKVSTSTGYITEVEFLEPSANEGERKKDSKEFASVGSTYKASAGSIGSVRLSDATKVIDAIKYESSDYDAVADLGIATKATLVNDTDYRAYGFGDKVNNAHPLVIVVTGEGAYNADTRFAVISDSVGDGQDDAGNETFRIPAFTADESGSTILIGSDELSDAVKTLNVGDVIVYQTDANGYIDDYEVIFKATSNGIPEYDALVAMSIIKDNDTKVFDNGIVNLPSSDASDAWVQEWNYVGLEKEPIQLIYGPVVAKNSDNTFSVGKIAEGTIKDKDEAGVDREYTGLYTNLTLDEREVAGAYEIDINDNTAVYEYAYNQSKRNRLTKGTGSSIRESFFSESNLRQDGDIIPWNLEVEVEDKDGIKRKEYPNKENVNFVFAKVVDGVATDVLVFIAE